MSISAVGAVTNGDNLLGQFSIKLRAYCVSNAHKEPHGKGKGVETFVPLEAPNLREPIQVIVIRLEPDF